LIDGVGTGGDGRARLVLLCREWSGRFGSRKAGRGLATKLHPHLIVLEGYVGTDVVEQQKRIDAREEIEGEGKGARGWLVDWLIG